MSLMQCAIAVGQKRTEDSISVLAVLGSAFGLSANHFLYSMQLTRQIALAGKWSRIVIMVAPGGR